VASPAEIISRVLTGVIVVRMLANWRARKPSTDDDPAGRNTEALRLLIEGEQRLLALFEARQASADAKMTAAFTGAVALPAATLALAEPLKANEKHLKWAYAFVVGLLAVVLVMRFLSGLRRRYTEGVVERNGHHRRRRMLSTESLDAALARKEWWKCEATTDPLTVQAQALELWRTRAKHSRKTAQFKDFAAGIAGAAFILALAILIYLVSEADFTTDAAARRPSP
jgi:hypothetical protein